MAVFTVVTIIFFYFSPEIFRQQEPLFDSGVYEESETKLEGQSVTVRYRSSSERGDYVELIIKIENDSLITGRSYEAAAIIPQTGTKIDAEVSYLYSDHYLVQLTEIPSNWRQLTVAFGFEKVTETDNEVVAIDYTIAAEAIHKDPSTKPQNKSFYTLLLLEKQEKNLRESIELSKKRINDHQKQLLEIEEKVTQNTNDMRFQNETEYEKTKRANETLQSTFLQLEESILEEEEQIQLFKEQMDLLKERRENVLSEEQPE